MARPSSRPRKDRQRRRFSPTSRRAIRVLQESVDSSGSDDVNRESGQTMATAQHIQSDHNLREYDPEGLVEAALVATTSSSSELQTPSDVPTMENTVRASRARDGDTKRYFQGYEYTRANTTSVKITYRCSYYRAPKRCPGALVFYADTMTFDVDNMVSHTCRGGVSGGQTSDASACIDVTEEMKAFVDSLIEEDMAAKAIWAATYTKFYSASTRVVRGLSHKQVLNRVSNARASAYGSNVLALLESPALAKVKNDIVGFLQFHYTWHDDNKAKEGKSGIERLIGWAHPELRNLLRYDGVHLFVDGTFRCVPKTYHQFVTLMMFDPLTDLFLPIFFTLATNKTEGLYVKMFKCIEFTVGKQPNPMDVVCDFEAALINAIQDQFPSTRLIGCLFHFKQACRRKMKEYALPDDEVGVAMAFGVLDMLTVIPPGKIAVQGVAWVKSKIKARLGAKDLPYSRSKWKQFWRYFKRTWVDAYPPDLWNIHGVQRQIVNRTNNPLERFHRELNARMKPHPNLDRFVRVIEEMARECVVLRRSIITGDATAPVRSNLRFPRAVTLPDMENEVDSDSEPDSAAESEVFEDGASSDLSDGELGMLYNTSLDYEEEEKCE